MQTRDIPQDQWVPFFDNFSRQHEGEKVTVELLSREFGAQPEAQHLPLLGITCEPDVSKHFRIELSAGDSPDSFMTHEISSPLRVELAQSEDGADQALRIESADGPATLLSFGSIEGPSTFGR